MTEKMKVFILEDNVERFNFIKKFYKDDEIIWEKTVPKAIESFEKHKPFDIILLDHDLGDDFDPEIGCGVDFAKYLSNKDIDADIIIHSLNPSGADRMKTYLPKSSLIPIIWW